MLTSIFGPNFTGARAFPLTMGWLFIRGIPLTEEVLQISDVPAYIRKLFLYRLTDFFLCVLPAFYKCQVVFPCVPAVTAREYKPIAFAHPINDIFQLFPCLVQEGDVLWVSDVHGGTGGIDNKCPTVWFAFPLGCIPIRAATGGRRHRAAIIFVFEHIFIRLIKDIYSDPLTEPYKRAGVKRRPGLIARETDKIL